MVGCFIRRCRFDFGDDIKNLSRQGPVAKTTSFDQNRNSNAGRKDAGITDKIGVFRRQAFYGGRLPAPV